MKIFIRSISAAFLLLSIASAEAKTSKYDFTPLHSYSGPVRYNGLQFDNPSSVILTVAKTPPSTEVKLAVEISFPKAAKLFATNFKWVSGSKYRAVVSDVWIYREVIVEVENIPFPADLARPVDIRVFVSERSAFNNPIADYEPNRDAELFSVSGTTRDITPTRNVDTLTTSVLNKKLTLSLKDRVGFNPEERRSAFVIEALWYGKGIKTIYIPVYISSPELDEVEAIALTFQGGTPENPVLTVKYKNADGNEMFASSATLQELLAKAYGQDTFNQQPMP